MKRFKKLLLAVCLFTFWFINIFGLSFVMAQWGNPGNKWNDAIWITISDSTSNTALLWDVVDDKAWADVLNNQVRKIINYIINIFIVVWIAVAFFWAYEIMFSGKEDATKDWMKHVAFWALWVIIMVSAKFLAYGLVWSDGVISSNMREWTQEPNGILLASNLYDKILFPFIRIVLYLVVGALFFMMAAKVVTFITSTDDAAKKKAGWMIIWTVIWILIIMWAKEVVEAIMWKQEKVLNQSATWIDGGDEWMWENLVNFGSVPLIANVLNWVMWLTMFAILVLIIVQAYKMFAKPDDPKNMESLKKTLLYIIIWVLVIWASYAISSLLVVNRLWAISRVS